mgnify:CR=1 FL=1
MKKKVMPVFLSVILVIALMATPIFAKDNQSEGQPFQEIWETITELQEWVGKFIENDPVFMASPYTFCQLPRMVESNVSRFYPAHVAFRFTSRFSLSILTTSTSSPASMSPSRDFARQYSP